MSHPDKNTPENDRSSPKESHYTPPVAAPCACASPIPMWGEVYGRDPERHVFWWCDRCGAVGMIRMGPTRWARDREAITDLDRLCATLGEQDAAHLLQRIGQEGLAPRALEEMEKRLSARIDYIERMNGHAEAVRETEHRTLLARLRLRLATKYGRFAARRAALPAPAGPFPLLVRGADACAAVVYGLVDPRQPELVRYVGRAEVAAVRLGAHVKSAREDSAKGRWLRDMLAQGHYPDMVLLERAAANADLDSLEAWWIHHMRGQGMADLNVSIPTVAGRGAL